MLGIAPWTHAMLRRRAGSQFTSNQFTIPILQQSIETSLRNLRVDCVDILFLHAAPASALEQDDLLDALGKLVEAGKVRVAGLSAAPDVVELALERKIQPLRAMQFPCNVFEISSAIGFAQRSAGDCAMVANQPFGGTARVKECRKVLRELAQWPELDAGLKAKLEPMDDATFADVVLNVILRDTGIHVAIPAMMRAEHIRANVRALTHSRFDSREIAQIREALVARRVD